MASAICCTAIRPGAVLRTSTGSFTVLAGVYSLKIWVTGGGAGANPGYPTGGANGSGSGGGAGGTAFRIVPVVPGQVIPYTIGANASPNINGSTTTLTVGAFTLTGNGGLHGVNNGAGGAGGTATGGSVNINGGNGGNGNGGNQGGAAGGSIFGVGVATNQDGTCGGTPGQPIDFQGIRAALALVVPVVTILGSVVPGCFGSGQVNGANGVAFGQGGSGTSAGPNSSGGSGNRGGGGGGSAANNSIPNSGGFGQAGQVLFAWG